MELRQLAGGCAGRHFHSCNFYCFSSAKLAGKSYDLYQFVDCFIVLFIFLWYVQRQYGCHFGGINAAACTYRWVFSGLQFSDGALWRCYANDEHLSDWTNRRFQHARTLADVCGDVQFVGKPLFVQAFAKPQTDVSGNPYLIVPTHQWIYCQWCQPPKGGFIFSGLEWLKCSLYLTIFGAGCALARFLIQQSWKCKWLNFMNI